jgi:uncharacterized membrane protein YheB (UPF0754 family)
LINKAIFCFVILFGFVSGYAQPVQKYDIISYAKESRVDSSLLPDAEQERLKQILSQTCQILPHYDLQTDIENQIKEFVKDTLSMEIGNISEFSVIDTRTTEFYGKSHDMVYLIQDMEGQVRYIVKAFENPCTLSGRFLPEISAIELIQEMHLPSIVPVKAIAFSILHDGENQWGLLLESAAKGKRLDQYVMALGNEQIDTQLREQNFRIAQTAFERFGQSLALLHSVRSTEKMPLNETILSKYDDKFHKVLKDPFISSKLSEHFSIDQLISYVSEVKNSALQEPLFYTYAHGDTNLGNVFYDISKDSISYIDLYAMHQSVNISGEPISDPIIDLVRAEDGFRKMAKNLLNEEEIETLLTSFYTNYVNVGGIIPEKCHLSFYKTYINLWRMILGSHYITEEDPLRREFDKATFEEGLEYFIQEINQHAK